MDFQPLSQTARFFCWKCFVKQRYVVRVQIIHYETDFFCIGIIIAEKVLDFSGPIRLLTSIAGINVSPSTQWLCEKEDATRIPFIATLINIQYVFHTCYKRCAAVLRDAPTFTKKWL